MQTADTSTAMHSGAHPARADPVGLTNPAAMACRLAGIADALWCLVHWHNLGPSTEANGIVSLVGELRDHAHALTDRLDELDTPRGPGAGDSVLMRPAAAND